jgi:16S rRNA (cytidine1402-2'-O)-methyltransferase
MGRAETAAGTSRTGVLYLLATPIGNLADITLRGLEALKQAHLIACEDTRHTRILLAHYGIAARPVAYHEHNERTMTPRLIAELRAGRDVVLAADAGTPLVSDPGYRLVAAAIAEGIAVVPLPGPSAVLAALAAGGLPAHAFTFLGFVPARAGQRLRFLKTLAGREETLVFFESPRRLAATLKDLGEIFGERRAVVARELTKVHEEFRRGPLAELASWAAAQEVRGEVTLLVEGQRGAVPPQAIEESTLAALAAAAPAERNELLRSLARQTGLPRSAIYQQLQQFKLKRSPP